MTRDGLRAGIDLRPELAPGYERLAFAVCLLRGLRWCRRGLFTLV